MLQKALRFIREHGYNVYSVCEWKDGNEQKEELQPANHANNCYSLSKSFTSAAIGMLEYAGKRSAAITSGNTSAIYSPPETPTNCKK